MVRGLYTAATGMVNQMNRMDVITNNLANSATTAYKKEGATSQAFREMMTIKINDSSVNYVHQPIGRMSLGVKIIRTTEPVIYRRRKDLLIQPQAGKDSLQFLILTETEMNQSDIQEMAALPSIRKGF